MPELKSKFPHDVQINWIPRIDRHFRLQWEKVQHAYVLLYPEGMIKLNDSAGEILSRCTGEHSIGDIVRDLSQKFPEAENIEQDILEFFADAYEHRWLIHG